MVHGLLRRLFGVSKRLVSRRKIKGEAPSILRHMVSGLHAETGCRKVYAGEIF